MKEKAIHRRTAIKWSLASAAGVFSATNAPKLWAKDFKKPVPGSEGLTSYLKDGQVQLRLNNMPLTVYRANSSLKYPYFYPLNGLASGTSLTTESSLPYPHHRGLWLGCEPLNGGDYWADNGLKSGQVKTMKLELDAQEKESAAFINNCEWVRDGAPSPWTDERKFTVKILSKRVWVIDAEIKLTAAQDIEIKKAKHSFFALRAAADISPAYGGVLMNSEGGVGAEETLGREADWCGYHGKRVSKNVVEGIAIMNHPENPWKSTWLTRDYGHLSPSPFYFLDEPWRLSKGKSIDLKYRVALHVGSPKKVQLNDIYQQWVDSTVGV